jgi:hypothetical protein
MFSRLLVLLLLLAPSLVHAGVLDATWSPPTTNTDGSALTDLGGFRVYYAVTSPPCPGSAFLAVAAASPSPQTGDSARASLTGLTAGVLYYVAVTALDLTGNESPCSSVASAVARADQVLDTTPPPNPGTPTIGTPVLGATTATFPVTWAASIDQPSNTPVPAYPYSAGYNDGSGLVMGMAGTTSINLVMPYHSSGLAAGAFFCVKAQDTAGNLSPDPLGSCMGFTVPAKPVAPPPPPPADTTPPSITIASSVVAGRTLTLAGVAADNVGVVRVTWSSSRGGSGVATGTTNWSASIPLRTGQNTVTVTAFDAAGNAGSVQVVVKGR